MQLVSKYIYFAANNMVNHPLYKKSFIVGETDNLIDRQMQYNVIPKGMQRPECGNLVSMNGESNLMFPFVDTFKYTRLSNPNTKNTHDKIIHDIIKTQRPFKDLVYHLKDKNLMNTKEAFVFYMTNDFIDDISRFKEFLIENLTDFHAYTILEYKFPF